MHRSSHAYTDAVPFSTLTQTKPPAHFLVSSVLSHIISSANNLIAFTAIPISFIAPYFLSPSTLPTTLYGNTRSTPFSTKRGTIHPGVDHVRKLSTHTYPSSLPTHRVALSWRLPPACPSPVLPSSSLPLTQSLHSPCNVSSTMIPANCVR